MKIGIFAKTFSRPAIEDLFQAVAGCEIYSCGFFAPVVTYRFLAFL
jgi:hypothetical protein